MELSIDSIEIFDQLTSSEGVCKLGILGTLRAKTTTQFLLFSATIMWATVLVAQPQEGEVSHWEDGSSMGCTYVFSQV